MSIDWTLVASVTLGVLFGMILYWLFQRLVS